MSCARKRDLTRDIYRPAAALPLVPAWSRSIPLFFPFFSPWRDMLAHFFDDFLSDSPSIGKVSSKSVLRLYELILPRAFVDRSLNAIIANNRLPRFQESVLLSARVSPDFNIECCARCSNYYYYHSSIISNIVPIFLTVHHTR